MNSLSANLVPFISQSDCSMLLVRLVELKKDDQSDSDVEQGSVTLHVLEVFRGDQLLLGNTIEVGYRRLQDEEVRFRNRFDQWNNLPLEINDLMVLVARPTSLEHRWEGLAARLVNAVDSVDIVELRRCYEIEALSTEGSAKSEGLEVALVKGKDLLRYYALDAIARRSVLPRPLGVATIDRAISDDAVEPQDKAEISDYLLRNVLFDSDQGADPTNCTIEAILAREFLKESEPKRQLLWMDNLGSCILSEFSDDPDQDRSIRSALIGALKPQIRKDLETALKKLSPQADEGQKETVRDLLKALRAAETLQKK